MTAAAAVFGKPSPASSGKALTPGAASTCPRALDQALRFLVGASALLSRARSVLQVRDALFEGFRPTWLKHNLKFDLSLSSGPDVPPSVRFSYNNFGEIDGFRSKVERVFSLYPGAYETGILGKVLDVMQPTTERHQTTLGFEWTQTSVEPRIKLYFEELQHRYSTEERREFARAVLKAAGDDKTPVPQESLAAIAVDFLPGGERAVKLYSLFGSLDEIIARVPLPKPLLGVWRRAGEALSIEKRSFYYLTRRHARKRLVSLKLYKIYEFAQFEGFDSAWREIRGLLKLWGSEADLRRISQLEALCRRNGGALYPVIASVDVDAVGLRKVDGYFSIAVGREDGGAPIP